MTTLTTPTFTLIPAQANPGNIIDYTTTSGLKLCNLATEELLVKFDCKSKSVSAFCEKLIDQANEAGQKTGARDTLTTPDLDGVDRDLLTEYGRFIDQDTRNHALAYMITQSCQAQNNVQMHNCLTK